MLFLLLVPIPMTPEIYRENLPWAAMLSVLGGALPDLSVWASTGVWFHQLRSGATSLQIEEANTQNKGIFSEEMQCIFRLCLWMLEVLRVGPKSHHTFSIWALKMHLVSCRWLFEASSCPSSEWALGYSLIVSKLGHLPHWETKRLKGPDCAVHIFWTRGGF